MIFKNVLIRIFYKYITDEIIIKIPNSNKKIIFKVTGNKTRSRAINALTKEINTIEWINKFNNNSIFVDVGSQIGLYSLYASIIKNCKSLAIEPYISNLYYLQENIKKNNLIENIFIFPFAITDESIPGKLYLDDNFIKSEIGGGFPINPINVRNELFDPTYWQGVHYVKLDDLLNIQKNIDYIKIDIDGNELKCLAGATETLKLKSLKSILIELNENSKDYMEILKIMQNNNFKLDDKLTQKSYVSTKRGSKIYNHIFYKR